MSEAENQFRQLRGGDDPIVVDGYQYPLLVLPIKMKSSDPMRWQQEGYAMKPVPPGFAYHARVALSNEYVPRLFVSVLIYFLRSGARAVVQLDDEFLMGPERGASHLYVRFNRRAEWLTNDGCVGFGAAGDGFVLFVDVYKHLRILGRDPDGLEMLRQMLEEEQGLSRNDGLAFLSDVPCVRGSSADAEQRAELVAELELEPCDPPPYLL